MDKAGMEEQPAIQGVHHSAKDRTGSSLAFSKHSSVLPAHHELSTPGEALSPLSFFSFTDRRQSPWRSHWRSSAPLTLFPLQICNSGNLAWTCLWIPDWWAGQDQIASLECSLSVFRGPLSPSSTSLLPLAFSFQWMEKRRRKRRK